MNNAFITKEVLAEEVAQDPTPIFRERIEQLTEIIEALQAIANSSHWKVLQKYVFDVDLEKAKKSIVQTKDTTEIFRLQGEIRWGDKFSLETLLDKYRNELSAIRKKLT